LRSVVSFNNILYTHKRKASGRWTYGGAYVVVVMCSRSVTESIVASLHFQFIFFLLGEKSLRIISEFFFVLLENTKFTKNTKNLPWIPGTHMKSLHNWCLVVTYLHIRLIGRKIAIRIPSLPRIPRIYQEYQEHTWNRFIISHFLVSNRVNRRFASFPIYFFLIGFFLIGRKITSHHFWIFFCLTGEYQVYQEYQEFTLNTRNTHEIASLLVSCGYLFTYTTNWA
jgi:hypothetical protein